VLPMHCCGGYNWNTCLMRHPNRERERERDREREEGRERERERERERKREREKYFLRKFFRSNTFCIFLPISHSFSLSLALSLLVSFSLSWFHSLPFCLCSNLSFYQSVYLPFSLIFPSFALLFYS
jgi:hypothetical protein